MYEAEISSIHDKLERLLKNYLAHYTITLLNSLSNL